MAAVGFELENNILVWAVWISNLLFCQEKFPIPPIYPPVRTTGSSSNPPKIRHACSLHQKYHEFRMGEAEKKSDNDNYSHGTKEGISGKRNEEIFDEMKLQKKEICFSGKKETYENKGKKEMVCLDKTCPVEFENKHKNNDENSLGYYEKSSIWGDSMFLQKEAKRKSWWLGENEVSKCKSRRCSHCEAENTPQWRMGPMGPKTLCNACGVRYMSGRLLPEYRPAASPTFDATKHSNFHRKILKKLRCNSSK